MDFSAQFPVLASYTYLNTANAGILSNNLSEWRRAHDQEFLSGGNLFRLNKDEFLENGRKAIADFFNADAGRTYLVPNFSRGFNIILEGLDGPKRFLLLKEDYPSVNYPVESRGHDCSYVEVDELLEQHIKAAVERFKPEVFAFSLVQYTSGIKIDLNFIKKLKADYPELLIIADGTQFCGTEEFDFEQSGIDALITSSYKWLLGGYGNGFVLLSEQVADRLYTFEKIAALPREGFLKGRDTLSLYFEAGHLDTLSFGTLFRSINALQEIGIRNIENQIKRLAMKAKQAFSDRNLLLPAVTTRKNHSSIFNLMIPETKVKGLETHHLIFSSRGAGIRVSFHFYNSEQDLQKLLQVIDS